MGQSTDCNKTNANIQNSDSAELFHELDEQNVGLLMDYYLSLRDETQLRIELQNKRLTQGVAAIGAILGYGLLSGNHSVVAVTPFILGLLYIESARTYRQIGSLATHLHEIEQELKKGFPSFDGRVNMVDSME